MRSVLKSGGFVVVFLASVGCSQGGDIPTVTYPRDQQEFSSLNQQCQVDYAGGQNEIQKSLAFNRCNDGRALFSRRGISGWVGRISDISTDQGADVVSVTIDTEAAGVEMSFGTVGNRVSDVYANSLIKSTDKLFNTLAQMRVGDKVYFDASFLPHPERADDVWEASLTEQGSIDRPEFIVRFSDIRLYSGNSVALTAQRSHTAAPPSNTAAHRMDESPKDSLSDSAASFDCRKARTSSEKAICSNSNLARTDAYTAQMYACLLKTSPDDAEVLRTTQRGWLPKRDACSDDVGCLRSAYGDIAEAYMSIQSFEQCQALVSSQI